MIATTRGRSRSLSKISTVNLSNKQPSLSILDTSEKTLFPQAYSPLSTLAIPSQIHSENEIVDANQNDNNSLLDQLKVYGGSFLDFNGSVFKIQRINKSLKSIKVKRKRTYYWKLSELGSLFMLKRFTSFSNEEICAHFLTSKTLEQVNLKLSENNNFMEKHQNEFYTEKFGRFQPKFSQIVENIAGDRKCPQYLNVCERLVHYLDKIKPQIRRLIKKPGVLKPTADFIKPKSECGSQPSNQNFRQGLKEDASTKMTEEDRVPHSAVFLPISEDTPQKVRRKKTMNKKKSQITLFDLTTENVSLPRVARQRSSSFHLGKRRAREVVTMNVIVPLRTKILKVGSTFTKNRSGVSGLKCNKNSSFFMMTNQFYKKNDALLGHKITSL